MSIFDFLRGEFIDVIHWTDDTRDTIVWRFEREGHAIKYGAKLTVREGQAAVFIHEGQLADTFAPGLYELETNNLPILTTLQHWDHGFKSPFLSEIYFVNTRRFTDLKWGTRNPIICRDKEFGMVRLRAFGTYTMRVTDPAKFLNRGRRHRRRVHHRGIEFQTPQHRSSRISARSSRRAASRCSTWPATPRARQARAYPDRPDGRRIRPGAPRRSTSRHLAARRGRERARQAHRHRHRRRPLEIHRLQRRRGDDQGGRQSRGRRRDRRGARRRHGHGDGRAHDGAHRPLGPGRGSGRSAAAAATTPTPPPVPAEALARRGRRPGHRTLYAATSSGAWPRRARSRPTR